MRRRRTTTTSELKVISSSLPSVGSSFCFVGEEPEWGRERASVVFFPFCCTSFQFWASASNRGCCISLRLRGASEESCHSCCFRQASSFKTLPGGTSGKCSKQSGDLSTTGSAPQLRARGPQGEVPQPRPRGERGVGRTRGCGSWRQVTASVERWGWHLNVYSEGRTEQLTNFYDREALHFLASLECPKDSRTQSIGAGCGQNFDVKCAASCIEKRFQTHFRTISRHAPRLVPPLLGLGLPATQPRQAPVLALPFPARTARQ